VKILQNKDVELRALEPEDLEILYQWENDTEVWHVSNTFTPISRYVLKKYLENAGKDIYEMKQLRLMIQLSANKKPIGTIDLFDFDPYHKRAGIGILIADRNERNKGYARQALESLVIYCFEVLNIHQLFCNIAKDNEESISLFANSGFVISGIKIDWLFRGEDGYIDELTLQHINPGHHK
jgi:diamine N-acetyltransferase